MKQKELESQLAEARLAKLQLELNQEKQAFLLEKQKLLQVRHGTRYPAIEHADAASCDAEWSVV